MELRQRAFSPFPLPTACAERVLSLYHRAVHAAGVEERMSTAVTQFAALRWLAKWSVRAFCLDHFLADHPDFVFQLKCVPPLTSALPCRSLRACGTALATPAAGRGSRGGRSDPALGSVFSPIPPSCCSLCCPKQLCEPKLKFLQQRLHMLLVRCMYRQYDPLS